MIRKKFNVGDSIYVKRSYYKEAIRGLRGTIKEVGSREDYQNYMIYLPDLKGNLDIVEKDLDDGCIWLEHKWLTKSKKLGGIQK